MMNEDLKSIAMDPKRSRAHLARWNAAMMRRTAHALETESSDLGAQGYVGVHGAADKLRELAGAVEKYANELDPPVDLSTETATERFERIADQFYRDTGYIAPGKSVPDAMWHSEYENRRQAAWTAWNKNP